MNRGNEHREERLILASSTFRFGIFTYLYSFYSLINNLKIFHISISQMRSRSKAMINVRTISFYLGARSLPPAIKVLQQGKLNKVGGGGQAPVILISHPLVRPLPFFCTKSKKKLKLWFHLCVPQLRVKRGGRGLNPGKGGIKCPMNQITPWSTEYHRMVTTDHHSMTSKVRWWW